MQNDMRDRLAELLSTNLYGNLCDHCGADNDFEKYKLLDMTADYLIKNDVVPVVRCKDCKHRYVPTRCALWYGTVNDQEYFVERGEDFYCSYGEMK